MCKHLSLYTYEYIYIYIYIVIPSGTPPAQDPMRSDVVWGVGCVFVVLFLVFVVLCSLWCGVQEQFTQITCFEAVSNMIRHPIFEYTLNVHVTPKF